MVLSINPKYLRLGLIAAGILLIQQLGSSWELSTMQTVLAYFFWIWWCVPRVAAFFRPNVLGRIAPPLGTLAYVHGERVTPGAGAVVVVEFWATWNPPQKESTPVLNILHKKYARSGLQVSSSRAPRRPPKRRHRHRAASSDAVGLHSVGGGGLVRAGREGQGLHRGPAEGRLHDRGGD